MRRTAERVWLNDRSWALCLLAVVAAAGCGDGSGGVVGDVDAGPGLDDGGLSEDGGTSPDDAGAVDDAGPTDEDGGVLMVDAGPMDLDGGTGGPGGDTSAESLSRTDIQIAVIPMLFSDQNEADLPTVAEIQEKFGGAVMQQLFDDNSSGAATLTVQVAPWQAVPRPQMDLADDGAVDDAELSGVSFNVPQFSGDTQFLVFFAAFNAPELGGGFPGSWTRSRYLVDWGLGRPSLNGAPVPHMMLLSTAPGSFDATRQFGEVIFDPRTGQHVSLDGNVTGESRPVDEIRATFAHEMLHYFGLGTHANSWDKGERFFFEPADVDAEQRLDYGNHFALLGTASGLTPLVHTVYRHFAGWGLGLIEEVGSDEDRRVTIAPINRRQGVNSVRFETDAATGNGVYLELRADDGWHDLIRDTPQLAGNLDGIMVIIRDGNATNPTSYVVDASPMPRATTLFPGQDVAALSDVVLKPGMEMHMPRISLSEVQDEADDHMSVRIQTFATAREVLHRPLRPTLTRNGNNTTVSWEGSVHPDTTGFEVEVIDATGARVTKAVTGANSTSTNVNIASIDGGTELHARVRAVGGGHPANWSRDAYILTP